MVDITALRSKLSSLTVVKKCKALGVSNPKESVPHTDYFETLYVNNIWYGRRNHKCYPLVVSFCAMSNSHFKYAKPVKDSILDDKDVLIEVDDSDYYYPCSEWTPFRKRWLFKGKVINNVVLVDSNHIDDQKRPKDD